MKLTEAQAHAIQDTGNLLVSAAAGAGKTFVLTQRVLRMVREGTPLKQMLILTFTRAAAAEMKERISGALAEAEKQEEDPGKKAYLNRQLLYCPNAAISTIDSFCSSVVRRYYYLEELSPGMTMLGETEKAVLLSEAADTAMTFAATERLEEYQSLLLAFHGAQPLKDAVLKLFKFLAVRPDRDEWLASVEEDCRSGKLTENAVEKLFGSFRSDLSAAVREMDEARALLPENAVKIKSYIDSFLPAAKGALEQQTPERYARALANIEFGSIKHDKDCYSDDVKAQVVLARDAVKTTVLEQAKLLSAGADGEEENGTVSALVAALIVLCRETEAVYAAAKTEKGRLDFNDIEYYCLKLLRRPEVAAEYRERFSAVIVDEYQDSNRLQEEILDCIRRPGGLFLVGDVKQSIYRFRNAEPGMFLEKSAGWAEGTCLRLSNNFRSSKEILDAVNSVFSRIMTAETGRLVYTEEEALKPREDPPPPKGRAELCIIETNAEDPDGDGDGYTLKNAEAETLLCAEKIRDIMEHELYTDKNGETRPYTYGDFTVLLRSKSVAPDFVNLFTAEGIPCYAQSSGSLYNALEVQLFLDLLRCIDNRRQDIPLVSVLRSFTAGFDDEDLMALRSLSRGSFLDCLLRDAAKEPGGKSEKFLAALETWRGRSLYTPMREFCTMLLDETGFEQEVSAMNGGRRRVANLHALLDKAGEYDGSGAFGLHGFLSFMDKASEEGKEGSAQTVGGDAVQIMTVHSSKGLEFPVVFYCDLKHKFNMEDSKKDLLLENELGIGLKYADRDNVLHEPLLHKALALKIARESREEEMRVLYVGMTRAVRQLYLVASLKNARAEAEKCAFFSSLKVRNASNALTWLLLSGSELLKPHFTDKGCFFRSDAETPVLPAPDGEKTAAFGRRLQREPLFTAAAGVPDKTSATALETQQKLLTDERAFADDPFREEKAFSALRHGTDIHGLLRRLPLGPDKASAREKMLAPLEEQDREDIEHFLASSLFKRMQASPLCRRELAFTSREDSGSLPGILPGGEVLLQGVIDCCFLEDGQYVLLDYKTDHFRGRTPEETAETHRMQTELYARALEKLSGVPVKEIYIVFISERTEVCLKK